MQYYQLFLIIITNKLSEEGTIPPKEKALYKEMFFKEKTHNPTLTDQQDKHDSTIHSIVYFSNIIKATATWSQMMLVAYLKKLFLIPVCDRP